MYNARPATTPLTAVKKFVTVLFYAVLSLALPSAALANGNRKIVPEDNLFIKVQESLWKNGIQGEHANLETTELEGISLTAIYETMDSMESSKKVISETEENRQ